MVRSAWVDCCRPRAGDGEDLNAEVLGQVFEFILRKFHNCRMGDYTRRISRNTDISKDQGSVALRTGLKAASEKTSGGARPQENVGNVGPKGEGNVSVGGNANRSQAMQ